MKVTIYRGTHEIGGSCIELTTNSTRIILDAGLPLVDANREPFDQRSIQGKTVEALKEEGTLPNVPGLFGEGPPPDAILLTHSHLDHSGLLHLSRPEVPIYASRGTSKMMLAVAIFGSQKQLDRDRHRPVVARQAFEIGDVRITPFVVDHSAFGAMAFLIESGSKSLLYSGDLRSHGRKPGMIKTLINEVGPRKIDVLLMEGTHFGTDGPRGITEFELEEEIVEHVKSAPSIVLAAFSPVDLDRLVTYYRAAQRTGRTFVVDAYTAFILHLTASEARVPQPTKEAGIRVYLNQAFERRGLENLRQKFIANRITLQEILEKPERHLMTFRPSMTQLDFEGRLPLRSRCLYSYWKGYLTKPEWVQLQEQLAAVDGTFVPAHTSGHIYVPDIIEFVRAISPRTVIPIHTFEPQQFRDHFSNVRCLSDGEEFLID